jgi:hypothetical protein
MGVHRLSGLGLQGAPAISHRMEVIDGIKNMPVMAFSFVFPLWTGTVLPTECNAHGGLGN